MIERTPLDYRQWIGSETSELGDDIDQKHVITHRYTAENGQAFNVLEVDARKNRDGEKPEGPTIVAASHFDYRIDPLLTSKMAILSHHTSARVLMSELPGVTVNHEHPFQTEGGWQTPKQTALAFSGNFDPLAKLQLEAVDSIADFEDGEEIQLFGQSLGAYSITAMARVLASGEFHKPLSVSKMTLFEPVNAYGNFSVKRQLDILKNLATIEDSRRQTYLDENEKIGHPMRAFEQLSAENAKIDKYVKSRLPQVIATYASGAGLRKGLHTALYDATTNRSIDGPRLYEADIMVARGNDSTVSHDKDSSSLAEAAYDSGVRIRLTNFTTPEGDSMPVGHHSLDSLGRMANFVIHRYK